MEDQLLYRIRKDALDLADARKKQRKLNQSVALTLDALEEVTGLQRPELERIADKAWNRCESSNDRFFSIKQQVAWAFLFVGSTVLLIAWLTRML